MSKETIEAYIRKMLEPFDQKREGDIWYESQVSQAMYAIDTYVKYVIGAENTDLASKYEEFDGKNGLHISVDDDESEDTTGRKLSLLSNFIADKTANEIYDEQRKRAGL